MPKTEKRPSVFTWRGLQEDLNRNQRLMVFTGLATIAFSLTFTQRGFAAVHLGNSLSFYAVPLLVPVSLAALLLGVRYGAAMGLLCGALLSIHAFVQPLDFFESVVISPVSTSVLFVSVGFLLGILFALGLRGSSGRTRRVLRIAFACLVVSVLFSVVFFGIAVGRSILVTAESLDMDAEVLSPKEQHTLLLRIASTGSPFHQLWCDFLLMTVCCLGGMVTAEHLEADSDRRPLRQSFGVGLLLAVSLGFLLTIAAGFVVITEREKQLALSDMLDEVTYLTLQRQSQELRSNQYLETLRGSASLPDNVREVFDSYFDVPSLLDGYDNVKDETVLITDGIGHDARILACNAADIEVGSTLEAELDESAVDAILRSVEHGGLEGIVYDRLAIVEEVDFSVYEMGYVVARGQAGNTNEDGFLVAYARPASKVFSDRGEVVRWMTLSTFVLLALVYLMVSRLLSKVVLSPVGQASEALDAICDGKLDTVVDARGSKEFVGLSLGINMTVSALKEWIQEAERRIEQELATARAIQESALPSLFPPFPDISEFDLYACMDPAREVGGDFYDFYLLDEGVLAFLIADVSGKGIPGALFMMEAKSELSNYMQSGMDLADVVKTVNRRLCAGNEAGMFVTAWIATLDYRHGILTYVNAGHNPPLLRHNGTWSWLKNRSGLFLGTFETATYKSFQLQLESGDELLLYTDGVNEAFSVDGEEYGNDRLEAFLAAHTTMGPRDIVDALKASVDAWAAGAEQSDDITILSLDYHQD